MGRLTALFVFLVIQCFLPSVIVATPQLDGAQSPVARDAGKPLLRLMPLGASITQGWNPDIAQEHQSGYRKPLRNELRNRGYPVNMVGSRAHGDFEDDQHEGWPGLEVEQVAIKMIPVLTQQKPNLVFILLGTNDCNHAKRDSNMEYARTAKDRMRTLINRVYSEVNAATVILATLPRILDVATDPYVQTANAGYRALAEELAKEGRKIELVDMYTTWLAPEDYSDSIHFKPSGYAKLAALFAQAFSRVEAKGWLTAPLRTGIPDSTDCYPSPNNFRGPIRTQQGSGNDDGDFVLSSTFEKTRDIQYTDGSPKTASGHFHFANVVHSTDKDAPLDELIRVLDPDDRRIDNLPFVSYHTNLGDATFDKTAKPMNVGQKCLSKDVRWGDVNGDGLDDFICLDGDGIPRVSLNRAGDPPKFEFIGAIREDKTIATKVHLADIDGDGRVDFCQIEAKGVKCWRNSGIGDAPVSRYNGSWENTFNDGKGNTLDFSTPLDSAGMHFIDMNGDGRADWFYLINDTIADVRINQRGDRSDGSGLQPHWREHSNQIEGWPHGDGITNENILFGKVFGTTRNDIIHVEEVDGEGNFVFQFYRNTSAGGAHLRGDGVRYCDMYGRGYDDYLWVAPDGTVGLFENIQSAPKWNRHGQILDTKRPGKFIHLGDWDGDGLCDILAVDHKTGNVDMWRNTYKEGDADPTFEAFKRVVDGILCPQLFTTGNIYDLAVRFSDLDGDKRVDYICLDPNGSSTARLNTPSGLTSPRHIKSTEGVPRSSIRFADVNGDERADYLAIDASTGAVHIWINLGIGAGGISWDSQPNIWIQGMERGANIHFPKLSTSGRADYHVVYPQTSVADTWFNEGGCLGGAGDDGRSQDPKLPVPPV